MRAGTITTRDGHELFVAVPQQGDDPGEVAVCRIDGRLVTRGEAQAFMDSRLKRPVRLTEAPE